MLLFLRILGSTDQPIVFDPAVFDPAVFGQGAPTTSTGRRRPLVPAPTARVDDTEDDDAVVLTAFLRHRFRI